MAVLAQNTITLIRVDDGADGKSVASITRQYYLSTSKIAPTGGSWTTTAPAWSLGKYLWTRYEIKYTNPSSTVYTTAYCDSSWEAINEIQIGGRNLVLNSNNSGDGWSNSNYAVAVGLRLSSHASDETGSQGYPILEEGETYTISCKANVASGTNIGWIAFYWSGNIVVHQWSRSDISFDKDKIYTATFVANHTTPSSGGVHDALNFYVGPNTATRGTSTLYWVKIEKGNKATDWTPAPEDTALSIDEIHNQLDGIDNIITNTQTNFEQKIDSITSTVEQTQQAVVDYQGQLTQIRTDISTEIEQVASGLNLTIEEIYNQFSDLGDVTETIRTFFKVTSDGLMIAQDGNPTSTLMGYDHFAVLLNNTEVVKIYQDSMQAPNGIFDSSVTIGPIKFEGYSEGVALKWVG